MKKPIYLLILLFPLLLTGCSSETEANEAEALNAKVIELESTVASQQQTINELRQVIAEEREITENLSEEFSYLAEMSEIEQLSYKNYTEENNPDYLTHFSPEGIVLLYLHSISISDWETIHTLTYDDGTLPDRDEFNELYYESAFIASELGTTLVYRYFSLLETRPENQTDEEVLVELSVSLGINHSTVVYELKKEAGIWKMDILDIM